MYDSNRGDYSGGVVVEGLPELKAYWRRVVDGQFQIVFRSLCPRAEFPAVCNLVMACGSMTLCVDEVDMYFEKGEPSTEFADVIRRGRREGVEVIGITQRPRRMGELRSMCRELYVFETTEIADLRYFKESFDDTCVEKIKTLRQYEYLYLPMPYDPEKIEVRKESNVGGAAIHHRRTIGCDPGGERPQGSPDSGDSEDSSVQAEHGTAGDDPVSGERC